MPKIALIDKAPNSTDYRKYFEFEFEVFHMSEVPISKLLKKDVTLEINQDNYDFIILVGSEAAKEYAKVGSVTNYAGQLVKEKYLIISNPAVLSFKPEGKAAFEQAISRINNIVKTGAPKVVQGDFKGITDTAEAIEFLTEVLNNADGVVAWDTEDTALYPRDGYVIGVSLSYKLLHGRYINADCIDETCTELLQKIADKYTVVMHNLKFDYKMLAYHLGLKFNRANMHDTMLMHYVLDENNPHGLKDLAMKYTSYGDYDHELEVFKKEYCKKHGILEEEFTYDLIPFDILSIYASKDTGVTIELYFKFKAALDKHPQLSKVYKDILLRGTMFLMDVEEVGIPISKDRMMMAHNYLEKKVELAKERLYDFDELHQFEKLTGKIFNPNSPLQLQKLLFDFLNLESNGKRTATNAMSTDAEVLEFLADQHPLPKSILDIRKLSKIQNTYVDKILPQLDRDNRIRTNFNMVFTTSGRLSSSGKFNAQQIPRDDPIIKGCIRAPDGYKIVSQDLQTGEMYYAAVQSGDHALQQVFIEGGDFHSGIAKIVFNLKPVVEEIKKLYPIERQSSKAVSFGVLYGSGPKKVADSVNKSGGNMTLSDAKEVISQYFSRFHKLKKWLDSRKAFIEQNGFTYSFFGRKRRVPNVFSTDKGIAAHEVRSAINFEIQSLCSDVNLLGAIDTAEEVKAVGLDAKIFMLVHDSIVALVKDECVEEYCKILKRNTQKDRGCSIPGAPIGVDQEIGQDYSFGKFEKYYESNGDTLSSLQAAR